MTRKAHLKINKVSVDFLISCLTAQQFSLPFSSLYWRFHFVSFLMTRRKKISTRQIGKKKESFFSSEEEKEMRARTETFLVVSFLSAENVSSNIEKSNYLYGSWTRRQIKLNCLLCETLKKCRNRKSCQIKFDLGDGRWR